MCGSTGSSGRKRPGETVAAALDIAFNGSLATAVLLSQRLIGAKRWVK